MRHTEAETAELGGRNTPAVDARWLVAERKRSAQLPLFLSGPLERARTEAGPRRLGVVVLSEFSDNQDGLVVLSARDFADWFGPLSLSGALAGGMSHDGG